MSQVVGYIYKGKLLSVAEIKMSNMRLEFYKENGMPVSTTDSCPECAYFYDSDLGHCRYCISKRVKV